MAEFVFQMIKARKSYGDRVILDDVTLSFLPGAKIGVVGPNGMGKSTLLKIMAGLETVSNGEASLTPGFTVGILQQEPPLDDTKTVGENIKMAFGPIAEKVARFNEIGEEMANPDADFDALMEEMGKLQTEIDAADGWDLDSQLEQAMDALQCPDPDTPASAAVWPCASCCLRPRTCCCSTSPPTTWTPSPSCGWNSSCTSTRAQSSPSPTIVTSWTMWPNGFARSTAATCTRTRATTPPTWRPRPSVWRSREPRTPSSPSD